jgi:iron(III) transport system permease protein
VSATSATAVVIITVAAAWLITRTRLRGRWIIDFLATLPLVFPGIVLGLGILRTYLTVPIPIYGTIWIIAVAFVAKFMPYGMRYNQAGLLSIHRELEESGQMSGASFPLLVRSILIPLLMPALMASWIYVFLVTSHELSEALLLSSPGNEIISITIWDLWQNGQIGDLTAFSVVVTSGLVVLAFVLLRLSRRFGRAF